MECGHCCNPFSVQRAPAPVSAEAGRAPHHVGGENHPPYKSHQPIAELRRGGATFADHQAADLRIIKRPCPAMPDRMGTVGADSANESGP